MKKIIVLGVLMIVSGVVSGLLVRVPIIAPGVLFALSFIFWMKRVAPITIKKWLFVGGSIFAMLCAYCFGFFTGLATWDPATGSENILTHLTFPVAGALGAFIMAITTHKSMIKMSSKQISVIVLSGAIGGVLFGSNFHFPMVAYTLWQVIVGVVIGYFIVENISNGNVTPQVKTLETTP